MSSAECHHVLQGQVRERFELMQQAEQALTKRQEQADSVAGAETASLQAARKRLMQREAALTLEKVCPASHHARCCMYMCKICYNLHHCSCRDCLRYDHELTGRSWAHGHEHACSVHYPLDSHYSSSELSHCNKGMLACKDH